MICQYYLILFCINFLFLPSLSFLLILSVDILGHHKWLKCINHARHQAMLEWRLSTPSFSFHLSQGYLTFPTNSFQPLLKVILTCFPIALHILDLSNFSQLFRALLHIFPQMTFLFFHVLGPFSTFYIFPQILDTNPSKYDPLVSSCHSNVMDVYDGHMSGQFESHLVESIIQYISKESTNLQML